MGLAPLAVVVGALTAAALIAGGQRVPRPLGDLVALLAALATAVLCALLLGHVWQRLGVYWLGGWHPRAGGVVLGIDLAVDPLGAGAATFAAVLFSAALVYSLRYLDEVTPLYQALMVVFLAGMVGFCLTGDLFDLFVFFELMSVPAYALTGYKVEEQGPIQGALGFAVTNSAGSFLTLSGIALIYGRTGALNLAQAGAALGGHAADGLVVAALALTVTGFLVKAAAVPFHFWLADAHAVAPAPVCVLFSGIMVQLGLYGVARVYWTVFAGVPGLHAGGVTAVLLGLGTLTALVGAAMTLLEDHLKRLLAFSTVSHTGLFLIALATFDAHGLAGAALFVLAHGLTKGALFMLVGIVGHRLGSVSQRDVHGRGRPLVATGVLFAFGGLMLASLPPFGPFLGKALSEEAATEAGYGWVPWLMMITSALAGGAILRAAARVFLGLGTPAGPESEEAEAEEPETSGPYDRTPAVLLAPAAVLLAAAACLPFVPDLKLAFDRAATRFTAHSAYLADVLGGHAARVPDVVPSTGPHTSAYSEQPAQTSGGWLESSARRKRR
jgi:multicomponent Na+:H+ antiporter subunit D